MIIKRRLRQCTIHNEMLRVHTWLLQLKFASLDLEKHKAQSIALFILSVLIATKTQIIKRTSQPSTIKIRRWIAERIPNQQWWFLTLQKVTKKVWSMHLKNNWNNKKGNQWQLNSRIIGVDTLHKMFQLMENSSGTEPFNVSSCRIWLARMYKDSAIELKKKR